MIECASKPRSKLFANCARAIVVVCAYCAYCAHVFHKLLEITYIYLARVLKATGSRVAVYERTCVRSFVVVRGVHAAGRACCNNNYSVRDA